MHWLGALSRPSVRDTQTTLEVGEYQQNGQPQQHKQASLTDCQIVPYKSNTERMYARVALNGSYMMGLDEVSKLACCYKPMHLPDNQKACLRMCCHNGGGKSV